MNSSSRPGSELSTSETLPMTGSHIAALVVLINCLYVYHRWEMQYIGDRWYISNVLPVVGIVDPNWYCCLDEVPKQHSHREKARRLCPSMLWTECCANKCLALLREGATATWRTRDHLIRCTTPFLKGWNLVAWSKIATYPIYLFFFFFLIYLSNLVSSWKGAASTQDLRQVACSMATYPIYLVIYLSNLSFYLSVYLCIYPIYLAI